VSVSISSSVVSCASQSAYISRPSDSIFATFGHGILSSQRSDILRVNRMLEEKTAQPLLLAMRGLRVEFLSGKAELVAVAGADLSIAPDLWTNQGRRKQYFRSQSSA
jgi:hypothetical protein